MQTVYARYFSTLAALLILVACSESENRSYSDPKQIAACGTLRNQITNINTENLSKSEWMTIYASRAIYRGCINEINVLLDMGLDVNSGNGMTLTDNAVRFGKTEIEKLLRNRGGETTANEDRQLIQAEKQKIAAKQQEKRASNSARSETNSQKAKPKNTALSDVGGDCNVRNASESIVIYHDTIIPESVGMSPDMICQMASEMVEVQFREAESAMRDICGIADELADGLGNGSYSRAITKVSSWEQDNEAKAALGLLNNCKSNESRLKLVKGSAPNNNIFSVGNFESNGKTCLGYLVELMPQGSSGTYGGSKAYELRGFKECKEFSINYQDKGIFHPETRPNGKRYGDYIVQSLKYDGEIPDHSNYKGKQYAFVSDD